MFTHSFHFSLFNHLSVFLEKPKLAQFIPEIYNKIIIKILGYFWELHELHNWTKLWVINCIGREFKVAENLEKKYWVATIMPVPRHCFIIKEKVCRNKALIGQDNFKEK